MSMAFQHHDVKETIRQKWDESSQSYDSHHGHGIKTQEEREAWKKDLKRILPPGNLDVLDVGCGTGEMSLLLAEMGHKVTGIDLSEKMLRLARPKAKDSKLKARFEHGDAEALKFKDESFDLVINRHLLWTLPHPEIALREWSRVLRQDGKVVVIDGLWSDGSVESRARRVLGDLLILALERRNPRTGWYPKETDAALPHPRGMSAEQAKSYLEEADLKGVNLTFLKDIRDIQRKFMPLSQKVTYDFVYYMIDGSKEKK
jgi:ubiquinone/menaquinone biosynthesis C-methylase UbiE